MDARLQRRVQRYGWDKASSFYEQFWSRQLKPAQDKLLELAQLKRGDRVLDIACGTGLVSLPAARSVGDQGQVVGTDISDQMVDEARRTAVDRGVNNVDFARMDAEELDLPDASFDCVLCALGLMYVPDPMQAVREMYRVLKPGGRVVAAVWGERSRCGWAEVFPIVESRVASDVCPLFFQLGTGNTLAGTLELAGFSSVEAHRLPTSLHYNSDDDALGAAFAGGPVALAYFRFDQTTRESAHADYLASIESFRDGSTYRVPGEFVVAAGRKAPVQGDQVTSRTGDGRRRA